MLPSIRIAALVGCLVFGSAGGAVAQDVQFMSSNRDWHTFTYTENGNPVCYMASQPISEEGNYTQRGDVFVLVTHRPAENSFDVVSFITGYTYRPESEVTVNVDGNTFSLFTFEDTAWARDEPTDRRLVEAMRAGAEMVVQGTSTRGTLTTDTYSLFGFTASHNEINQVCNR